VAGCRGRHDNYEESNLKGDIGMKKLAILLALGLMLVFSLSGCGTKTDNNKTDQKIAVAALTALADSHVLAYLDLLQNLAATPQVQSADWEQMQNLLTNAVQTRIAAQVYFFLPDGTAFMPGQGKTAQGLSDRDYFPKVMAGNNVVGNVLVGKVSNIKSYLVAVPVKVNGKVVGGLATTPYLDKLSQSLSQEIGLDNTRVFYALDGAGTLALSSDVSQIMAEKPVLSQNVVWQTSSLTGWRFALGSPAGK
jgi:hypothetical protein